MGAPEPAAASHQSADFSLAQLCRHPPVAAPELLLMPLWFGGAPLLCFPSPPRLPDGAAALCSNPWSFLFAFLHLEVLAFGLNFLPGFFFFNKLTQGPVFVDQLGSWLQEFTDTSFNLTQQLALITINLTQPDTFSLHMHPVSVCGQGRLMI